MGLSINIRQAYSEVDEFLSLISNEKREKIPQKLREFFKEEKDMTYIKGIKEDIPINNQQLREETLAIIAYLNLNYWCDDENEKERLKAIYQKNEHIYNDMLQVQFSPSEVFKNQELETKKENRDIVGYKESIIKKFINRFKKLFSK